MDQMPKKPQQAFTLIEIMTVTAILGIMVMAISPSISATSRNAKASQCSSNLRVIQSAKAAYLMENLGKIRIDNSTAQDLENFRQFFPQRRIPEGCPSMDNPLDAPYINVFELYQDVACGNNCPKGQSLSDYPYEPDIGGPDYYRNGYHDLHRRQK
jgi:prepilin-type N-terminal cleavage/methylation domain-containing protein